MIPNAVTPEGIALGNEIVAYVFRNAARFGMQDAIWRGVYYTPNGAQRSGGYGHFDHVHVTTTGGGYPTGGEIYYRWGTAAAAKRTGNEWMPFISVECTRSTGPASSRSFMRESTSGTIAVASTRARFAPRQKWV